MSSDLWGQLLIASAIVVGVWKLDGHFITRREFLLQVELLRRDIQVVRSKLGCHDCDDGTNTGSATHE